MQKTVLSGVAFMSDFIFREISVDDQSLSQIGELMEVCFPDSNFDFSVIYLNWLYKDNPIGHVIGFNAFDSDQKLVGHYATIPVQSYFERQKEKGLLSLNTAIHPSVRGKGLFTRLAQATYDWAKELKFRYVIGVANQNSTHGFKDRLGFNVVSPLDVKIGFGLPEKDSAKPDEYRFKPVQNLSYLKWRLSRPGADYRFVERSGAILSPTHIPGLSVVLGHCSDENVDALKVSSASCHIAPTLWMGLGSQMNSSGKCMITLPECLRPSPLNFIFLDLSGKGRRLKKNEVYFSPLEFDAY